MNETQTKVYVIEVRGNDYYDDLIFHSVYANREDAEQKAEMLRKMICDGDAIAIEMEELLYEEVVVNEVTLN